ncbi:MAG: tyrosine-type recombinase/integrase [Clostridia bacterium]|nr:tyrosine-type recombinase/integrase [Clostridia bacterium]
MVEITNESIKAFKNHLMDEEKSTATVQKYIRDVVCFSNWLGGRITDKSIVLEYKAYLCEKYAPASVNAALSSLNSYFAFCGRLDLKVKNLKIQRRLFVKEERELTKQEYERLLEAAKRNGNQRLHLLIQTICSTGIRVSEVKFITAESISRGYAEISCKGKYRHIYIPTELCKALKRYAKDRGIKKGPIFITKSGKVLDRSNIWSDMKKLCRNAGVSEKKVFPHNLRHLFARTYYSIQKDIVRLADILGHSSVNTTRIYTVESGSIHKKQIQKLGLLYTT